MIKLTSILPESTGKPEWLKITGALLFLALFAFPLLPLKAGNAVFILFSLITIIIFIIKPIPVRSVIIRNLVFIIPFIPYLFEFFSSGFNPLARFEFEKKILLFVAPILIPVFLKVSGFRNYKLVLLVFSLSVAVLTMATLSYLFAEGTVFDPASYINGAYILRNRFEVVSGIHPTYFSILALCAGCFLCHQPYKTSKGFRAILIVITGILFATVMLLAVKISIIIAVAFIPVYIMSLKLSRSKKIILVESILILLVLLMFLLPSIRSRLTEVNLWITGKASITNTVSQREMITSCSWKIFTENIWLGTGSENFQKELNNCYASKGWSVQNQSFNPHNQFLSEGINYGIFFLLIFIACLIYIFIKIFHIPEARYFIVTIILVFLSESILERQMGVYFFSLIAVVFYNMGEGKSNQMKSVHNEALQ